MLSVLNRGKAFYADLVKLVIPIMLQNLITNSLGLMDTFMVGLLPGEAPIAGVALANIPIFVILLVIFGMQSGASVLISQFWGKRDVDSINRVLGVGVYTAGGITVLFSFIMSVFPVRFMGLFSNNGELVAIAAGYARIVGFSYIFESLTQLYIGAHRSMENPKLGLYILSISMCSNTFLNWVLIFGKLGAPALGVTGAALATLLSRILQFIVMVIYALGSRRFSLRPSLILRPGKAMLSAYVRYATPVVFNETFWGLGTCLYPTIMGHMAESTGILAAFTVAGNIDKICTVAVFALAAASAVIVGREIGAGHIDTVFETGSALAFVALFSGLAGGAVMIILTFSLIAPWLYPLFTLSERTTQIATMMLVVTALVLPLRAFNSTNIVGVLRGGGDVHAATAIDLIPLWFLALPMSVFVGLILHLDILWVYLCITLESILKFFLGVHRFRSRAWINDVTQTSSQKP